MINLGVNLREAKRGAEAISLLEEAHEAPDKPPAIRDFASRQLLQTYMIIFQPEHRQHSYSRCNRPPDRTLYRHRKA